VTLASRLAEASASAINAELEAAVRQVRELTASPDPQDLAAVAALAVHAVREELGVTLHDGQIMAGLAMASGWTVQMRTGEGKTFAAIIPALVHARAGTPVHVVTSNPYLAGRDADWSGAVLRRLGFTTAALEPGASREQTRKAYAADVTYGSGAEFGFDYLRDNLYLPGDAKVQRGRSVAIVDEADAVLLDNARTPLVLSAPAQLPAAAIRRVDNACRRLRPQVDVEVRPALQRVELTEQGVARCEELLGVANLYEPAGTDWPHLVRNALRARAFLTRDRDYVVLDGRLHVVEESTGRIAPGRRWSDGLHQAVEAKEGLALTPERRPVGRITIGDYFLAYDVLVGMSGTLEGAHEELQEAYGMRTVVIPPDQPQVRRDEPDVEFATSADRLAAVAADIASRHAAGQPVLIGTTSIAQTQDVSAALERQGVAHRTLTARNDAEEAEIIAAAGAVSAVTVATQMAGRGVDIRLGAGDDAAHEIVRRLGGLMVWGIEHHRAVRLDMQLRGRSGRQGDPGETRFAVCPEDALLELEAGTTEECQQRAEELDRDTRADVRRMDEVVDRLHDHLYRWRERVASGDMRRELDQALAAALPTLVKGRSSLAGVDLAPARRTPLRRTSRVEARVRDAIAQREQQLSPIFDDVLRTVLLELLVQLWAETIDRLDAAEQLAMTAGAFAGQLPAWTVRAVGLYRSFEESVRVEWLRHVFGLRVLDEPHATPQPTALPAMLPAASAAWSDDETEQAMEGTWTGWSFNAFIRGRVHRPMEPPLVLELDAVGDQSASALHLQLDLDDPTGTTLWRPRVT
jgi:preprotein translocase subunit SecA